jgi:hypothetical protein
MGHLFVCGLVILLGHITLGRRNQTRDFRLSNDSTFEINPICSRDFLPWKLKHEDHPIKIDPPHACPQYSQEAEEKMRDISYTLQDENLYTQIRFL